MILNKPLLQLNRLRILSRGASVYDEKFHEGVNIIRGENGHGKSTIADFIFFVLGGEVTGWKPEAERCETVWAEVNFNETTVVLRRIISVPTVRSMELFWGSMDSAIESPFEGWQRFPLNRFDEKENFSQIVFRILDFPEVRADRATNLTMNQLLRLMYVDQMSSVHSLLREEPFDTPSKRQAIADILFGLYDDSVFADQLRQREVEKGIDIAKAEYESLFSALKDTGQLVEPEEVEIQFSATLARYGKIKTTLDSNSGFNNFEYISDVDRLEPAQARLLVAKKKIAEISNLIRLSEVDIADSTEFISNLERRLNELDDSISTESSLGHIPLTACPECMQALSPAKEGHCSLCGQAEDPKIREKQMARLRQELATQIQESRRLILEKNEFYDDQKRQLAAASEEAREAQIRFDDIVGRTRSNRDSEMDDLLSEKGRLEGRLEYLANQRRLVSRLLEAKNREQTLSQDLEDIKRRIERGRQKHLTNRAIAEESINRFALEILKRDLDNREEWFRNAQKVTADFKGNFSSVDDRDVFSASSITYLKSAVHFAIFFSSLELPFFRYPKFILNDNIEDKGMEDERSHNLQRIIVEISGRFKVKHQIIIMTSKIAPEFDNTLLCVGPSYVGQRKTLNFK